MKIQIKTVLPILLAMFMAGGALKAAPAPEKKVEKKAAPKGKAQQYRGEVTGMDTAAKTLTVKGKKGDMTFDVTNAKMKAEPKAGDKVMVKYVEKDGKMIASSVIVKGAKAKTTKTTTTTKEKKEETTAPAK